MYSIVLSSSANSYSSTAYLLLKLSLFMWLDSALYENQKLF